MKTNIKTLIIDMDGVIWLENNPIGDLKAIFEDLRRMEIKPVFLTNNSTKTPAAYVEKLAGFGVIANEKDIITSSAMLANQLKKRYPQGGPVYIIGENGLIKSLSQSGFYHQTENVLAVVGGLDRKINYEKLKVATNLLCQGADFYFTNADASLPTPYGNTPGAGVILAALSAGSGRKANVIGKPAPEIFRFAMETHFASVETTMVVGDRLETDILGGINAGCVTTLVLSGVSSEESIASTGIIPDFIFKDLGNLVNALKNGLEKPV